MPLKTGSKREESAKLHRKDGGFCFFKKTLPLCIKICYNKS